jgi:serine/threonine-protein kinase
MLKQRHSTGNVHGRINPSNLLMHNGTLQVIDRDEPPGVSAYTAPEVDWLPVIDLPAEIFTLGAILYEILTGQPLFSERTPGALMRQKSGRPSLDRIQGPFRGVIAKCLSQKPGERPTAESVVSEIDELFSVIPQQPVS